MVQAVVFGGIKQESPPARCVEADIDVLVGADRQAQGTGEQGCSRQEIEESADAKPDQEEFDRIAHGPFVDIQLGDRKSVGSGKSVSVRVDFGGRRIIKKKNRAKTMRNVTSTPEQKRKK